MRLDLHPDVYAVAHQLGMSELDDRLVAYLCRFPSAKAVAYLQDQNIRRMMLSMLSSAVGDHDVEIEADCAANRFGIHPAIVSAAKKKGYEMNSNFASFLSSMSDNDALSHIATMRTRKKKGKDSWRSKMSRDHTCPVCGGATEGNVLNVTGIKSKTAWAQIKLTDEQISELARGMSVISLTPIKDPEIVPDETVLIPGTVDWEIARAERAETKLDQARQCLAFFASAIKAGEPWSETCESEYRKVK